MAVPWHVLDEFHQDELLKKSHELLKGLRLKVPYSSFLLTYWYGYWYGLYIYIYECIYVIMYIYKYFDYGGDMWCLFFDLTDSDSPTIVLYFNIVLAVIVVMLMMRLMLRFPPHADDTPLNTTCNTETTIDILHLSVLILQMSNRNPFIQGYMFLYFYFLTIPYDICIFIFNGRLLYGIPFLEGRRWHGWPSSQDWSFLPWLLYPGSPS